jgi:hypothetical protein
LLMLMPFLRLFQYWYFISFDYFHFRHFWLLIFHSID